MDVCIRFRHVAVLPLLCHGTDTFYRFLIWIGVVNQLLPETEVINRFAP